MPLLGDCILWQQHSIPVEKGINETGIFLERHVELVQPYSHEQTLAVA